MKQLEIKFFWPLTEQIDLPLDYSECDARAIELRNAALNGSIDMSRFTMPNGGMINITNSGIGNITSSFTIDIDQSPLTLRSSKKPNIFRRYLYKILGVRWQSKC